MAKKETTSPIILIAIILFGVAAGYIYYSQFSTGLEPIPTPSIAAQDTLTKFSNLHLDFAIFDQAKFQSLHVFGEAPVQPGALGRADIFAAY